LALTPTFIDASRNGTPWPSKIEQSNTFSKWKMLFRRTTLPLSLERCTGRPAVWAGAAGASPRQ
jgi:hypothetical protein